MQPQTSSTFRQRLGYYLTGVAIGLMLLGFFWMSKQQALRAQQAEKAAAAANSTPVPPNPSSPPAPAAQTPPK